MERNARRGVRFTCARFSPKVIPRLSVNCVGHFVCLKQMGLVLISARFEYEEFWIGSVYEPQAVTLSDVFDSTHSDAASPKRGLSQKLTRDG